MTESVAQTADSMQQVTAAEAPRYGGFWVRLAAHFVDSVLISLLSMAFNTALMLVVAGKLGVYGEVWLVTLVIGMFYHAAFVSSASMATPGKRLFGLYVTDEQGRRLGIGHALGRHLAAALSWLTLGIGFVMIAYSDRKQALHDYKAGTLVHRKPGASTGGMIVVFGMVFVLVFGGGILWAVGLPAIAEYGAKKEMENFHQLLSANKVPIQDYARKNHEWPTTWEQIESAGGRNPMKAMEPVTREFVKDVQLGEFGSMIATIEIGQRTGKLSLAPRRIGNELGWTCNASPDVVRFMPENCGAMQ